MVAGLRCPELRLCAAAIQDSLPPAAPCELVVLQKVVGEWYEPEWWLELPVVVL